MALRLIHTADWQIGKPFGNFPPDLAGELSAARLDAIGRIAAVARQKGAELIVVAGDIFDSGDLPAQTVRRALERLAAETHVRWLLLPGNHDPARIGGLWDRTARYGLPANVEVLVEPRPFNLGDQAVLLPAPLRNDNPGSDPTEWMVSAASAPGVTRIGLAHGSVQGFGSEQQSSVLIARNRAETAGLAYLALGDWHGVHSVSASTWYSGTPEPDRFPDNEPGFVLSVTIDDHGGGTGAAAVEQVSVAHFTWAKTAAVVRSVEDLAGIERSFAAYGSSIGRTLVRLSLSGSLSLADHARLAVWTETWAPRLRYLDIDSAALAVTPEAADFDSLGGEGPLTEAARELSRIAADARHPEREAASLALVRLFGFAAEVQREGLT